MEAYEIELVERYLDQDEELRALWKEHLQFEKDLERFTSKPFLTPGEETEMKEMKKLKLAGKTKCNRYLSGCKTRRPRNGTDRGPNPS